MNPSLHDDTGWNSPQPESLPRPTAWPLVLALGASLIAWGIVTSWIISVIGLVLFGIGAGGWVAEMRYDQKSFEAKDF